MKYTIKDDNSGATILSYELSKGYKTQGIMEVEKFPLNMRLKLRSEAVKESCTIHYESGDCFIYEKIPDPRLKYIQYPYNDNGRYYSKPLALKEEIDKLAEKLLKNKVEAITYYDLPDQLKKSLEESFHNLVNGFVQSAQQSASMVTFPIGNVIRKYLCDGAVGLYEDNGKILAIFLCREGLEYDMVQTCGVSEQLSDLPYGQTLDNPYASASNCEWDVPYLVYMISDDKNDLKDFMSLVETIKIEKDAIAYGRQIQQQVAMQNQAYFNSLFANQAQGWAASDRLGQQLSQDLDQFHSNLNQQMAQFDARIDPGNNGESYDDRIQRMRHESIMGVNTYERGDGTTYEYDNSADRVFENNLDNTSHFGTRNYLDDYVPEGWHEMKKK